MHRPRSRQTGPSDRLDIVVPRGGAAPETVVHIKFELLKACARSPVCC